jgi:hypothetical protein
VNWYWVRERGERMEEESGEGCRELLFFLGGNVGVVTLQSSLKKNQKKRDLFFSPPSPCPCPPRVPALSLLWLELSMPSLPGTFIFW